MPQVIALLGLLGWGMRGLAAERPPVVIHEIYYHSPSGRSEEQFVELRNLDHRPVDLRGWEISGGIGFRFETSMVLEPDALLVLAADPGGLRALRGGGFALFGPWQGRLSRSGESLVLRDATGQEVDRVDYSDDGEWSVRLRGPVDGGHRGLVWSGAHDGGGFSLELIQPGLPNEHGQNWSASRVMGGTPGEVNSVGLSNAPPLIVGARHRPWVPRSNEPVIVTARLMDESPGVRAVVRFRVDGTDVFESVPMADDGALADAQAGDGWFSAQLPARPSGTLVEWFVEAWDDGERRRTWPAPVEEDAGLRQSANALYVVDDAPQEDGDALVRIVLRAVDREELLQINRNRPPAPYPTLNQTTSHAQFNGTFIVTANDTIEGRYNVDLRNRGNGSRAALPQSLRVNIPGDRRWEGVRAVNLNSQVPDLQLLGSVLMRRAGLASAMARPIQVRFNTENPTFPAYPSLGFYVASEVIDGDFAERQFPLDAGGAIYRGQRLDFAVQNHANLGYLGEDPTPYRALYFKRTDLAVDDWTDLIELTRVASTTPDDAYVEEMRRVADVEQWALYFAANSLLNNQETSPVNGQGDDYFMRRGASDRRFQLLPYDLDTLLGAGFPAGSPTDPLFQLVGRRVPAFERFLTHPAFAPLFFREVRRLATTVWSPVEFDELARRTLGGRIPEARLTAMTQYLSNRVAFALGAIPSRLTAVAGAPHREGQAMLTGVADPTVTSEVRVNGMLADWQPWTTRWSWNALALTPGVNRLVVEAIDVRGTVLDQTHVDVTRDAALPTRVEGALSGDVIWTAGGGPYVLNGDVTVPLGASLQLDPGVTVYAAAGSQLTVAGRFEAVGEPLRRIRFTALPGLADPTNSWGGIRWIGGGGAVSNRLVCVDVEHAGLFGSTLTTTDTTLLIDQCTFAGTTRTLLETHRSSLEVRRSVFPPAIGRELVHGSVIPEGGRLVLEGNRFGGTTAGNDVVDFSGARRPGPILEVRNNVFLGSADDVLNLDGCDAHVEGNLFLNVSNGDPDHPNTSSAVSFGSADGYPPHVVVVRNFFMDVDHLVLCKEGGRVTLEHNTALRVGISAVNFSEPARGVLPGGGARLEGNVFLNCPLVLENTRPANGTVGIEAARNVVLGGGETDLGAGNWIVDPLLVNPGVSGLDAKVLRAAMALQNGSPVLGLGRAGLDPGATVPAGAAVRGLRRRNDWRPDLALEVYGPGLVAYRWRLDGGPWSSAVLLTQEPLVLRGLEPGDHRLEVVGLDSAGRWQTEAEAWVGRWTTDPAAAGVRLSEVLASTAPGESGFVELWNDSMSVVDLSGWRWTVGLGVTASFPLPVGTSLNAGERRAFPQPTQPRGGEVVLWSAAGDRVDEVRFGDQVPGLSLGRWETGWGLATPTPGAPNHRMATGNPSALRINEWLARQRYLPGEDFVELFNPLAWPVPLEGLALTDNPIGHPARSPWPPLSFLGAGQVLVWTADGGSEPGHVAFRLSGEGGDVALVDREGRTLDQVQYLPQVDDRSEGRSPDGGEVICWFRHPTPGRPNPRPEPSSGEGVPLRLNELFLGLGTGVAEAAWVEIANTSDREVDASGLELTTDPAGTVVMRMPDGSRIGPKGYGVIPIAALGLGPAGGNLLLWDRAEAGGGWIDGIRVGPQPPGFSVGRMSAEGGRGGWGLNRPTPGASNESAPVHRSPRLKINEWMADSRQGPDWVELYSPETLPADISGMTLSDDPEEPARYRFPALSYIGAGESAFLVIDAAQSRWEAGRLGFALRREGEQLTLRNVAGAVVDGVRFGRQSEGVSEGRWLDGTETITSLVRDGTPGAPNVRPSAGDQDGDGLPDDWEAEHGLAVNNAHGSDGALGDADGDGLTNVEEFEAGTLPNDPDSRVTLHIAGGTPLLRVRFRQERDRRYTLQARDAWSMESWETVNVWEPLPEPLEREETVNPTHGKARFYRLNVRRP
jgi:hypothetical protein